MCTDQYESEIIMNAFLADNLCDISLQHWTNYSEMRFSHTHPQYELYFCSDNVEQKSVINGADYQYHYPCVIISSPYTVHAMSCADPSTERYERFVMYFDEGIVEQFDDKYVPEGLLCQNSGYMFPLTEKDAEYLKNLILAIDPNDKIELRLLLITFLKKLVSLSPLKDAICVGKSSFYIQDVLQYVAEHYFEQIDATVIAQKFLISRSKLDRDFKQFTGITIHAFLDMCRINQAKILLETFPEMSVTEISSSCGFLSETYFFPFFKKNVGMTPAEYKKRFDQKH
ncbi:MAG: helix-turn-helix transcriptional regulator [Clostridia bacterium]|nr:helix-turn-helix transcriptional regulator [Clostridia bacterium]